MAKSNPDIKAKRSKRWKMEKPTTAGIYWVRGFEWGNHLAMALVEVIKYRNKLICNLHQVNSEREKENWSLLSDFDEDFEWLEVKQ